MKTLGYTLLVLTMSVTGFAQTDTVVDGKRYGYISRFDNSQVQMLGNFLKGDKKARHGHWLVYKLSGEILEKGKYKNNAKSGFWWEGGTYGKYKKGLKHGKWYAIIATYWYKKGERIRKMTHHPG